MMFKYTPVKDIIEDLSFFEDVKYGLYSWRLSEETNFNGFENSENDRVVYVGKAEKYIADRFYDNHLNLVRNFSTFRRSIGAVLKEELSLGALPKIDSKGNIMYNAKNVYSNYRFNEDGELKINKWIIDNLEYGFIELDSGVDDIIKILKKNKNKRTDEEESNKKKHRKYMKAQEKEAKKIIKPSLNCQSGDQHFNIYFKKIRDLRAICRDEAENNS